MPGTSITLDQALDLTRTGDVWLFRGSSMADRAIRMTTNSPVNHVGMSVVLEDLPPLMWHAELGRSLPDMWSGNHQRGVQLHDLRSAVLVWGTKYGQQAWLRQLDQPVTRPMEDALLRTIARLDGTPFPSTVGLATRRLRGRVPSLRGRPSSVRNLGRLKQLGPFRHPGQLRDPGHPSQLGGLSPRRRSGRPQPQSPQRPQAAPPGSARLHRPQMYARHLRPRCVLQTAYCAEVIAVTYEAMGPPPAGRRPSWYDAGRFWSGDSAPPVRRTPRRRDRGRDPGRHPQTLINGRRRAPLAARRQALAGTPC